MTSEYETTPPDSPSNILGLFTCLRCSMPLEAPGGLLFSPPNGDLVCKSHICSECYKDIVTWLTVTPEREETLRLLELMYPDELRGVSSPEVDGERWVRYDDVPDGWEWKFSASAVWNGPSYRPPAYAPDVIVIARPVAPESIGVLLPLELVKGMCYDGHYSQTIRKAAMTAIEKYQGKL